LLARGVGVIAGAVWGTALGAQAAPATKAHGGDVCALSTNVEFQQAQGVDPRIGILPSDPPVATQMVWGPHCDFSTGSIDLFTEKTPSAELERVLKLTNARPQRDVVTGLGARAFFTVIYPDDQYRRRGFLALFPGSKIVTISLDPGVNETPEAMRPKLEGLAKLVLARVD
jgi:hypothetical protein